MSQMNDLENVLRSVERPARYLGGEWNEIRKNPEQVKIKVALIFPDLYEIGMSYLGQKILYFLMNANPSILAERVFAPWVDFEERLRTQKIPLYSLENRIPLNQFDVLGFSLLYELNYSNILTILDLGRVPLKSSERDLNDPLVIAGGPCVFNPEPIADIFDLFLMGDGEEASVEIVEKYMTLKKELKNRQTILRELAEISGVYVPSLYESYQPPKSFLLAVRPIQDTPAQIEKRIIFPLHRADFPEKIVVPNAKVVFDRVSVEVARGCSQRCRFCQASSIYFPPREKSPGDVCENVLNSLRLTGYEEASLASLSISDYPYLDETIKNLMGNLEEQNVALSLSSLRPKGLSSEITENIIRVRKTGLTLVPEAGTERLRCVINKKLKDSEILEAARNAFSQGWRLLKLYFMVGLPTEREEDLEGIISLVREIVQTGLDILGYRPKINISISAFIPKPHTPFQWLGMEEERVLKEKLKFLRLRFKKYPSVKFKGPSVKSSILEGVFSRGDRQLNAALFRAWQKGARFDSWRDVFNFRIWEESFSQENIEYYRYLFSLDRDQIFPWDHINTGFKKSYLLSELDQAFSEKITLSCLETKCGECGGCSLSPLLEREFSEKIEVQRKEYPPFGEKKQEILRYRANYSKLERARYFSHMDVNNIIQRAFRRAQISVAHSKGYHPKMQISFPPALPLGMEGKAECLEFKSYYLFEKKDFVSRINNFLPTGLRFFSLKRVKTSQPSLNEEIKTLVYSLDLKTGEIKEAIDDINREMKFSTSEYLENVEILVCDYLSQAHDNSLEKMIIDRRSKRLSLYIKHSPHKAVAPQEIIKNLFRLKNPVFSMARERVLFHKQVMNRPV